MLNGMPSDPIMLLSTVNMKLRDFYPKLQDLCEDLGVDQNELEEKLRNVNYEYDAEKNQFV